jgi:hypothetical protein
LSIVTINSFNSITKREINRKKLFTQKSERNKRKVFGYIESFRKLQNTTTTSTTKKMLPARVKLVLWCAK